STTVSVIRKLSLLTTTAMRWPSGAAATAQRKPATGDTIVSASTNPTSSLIGVATLKIRIDSVNHAGITARTSRRGSQRQTSAGRGVVTASCRVRDSIADSSSPPDFHHGLLAHVHERRRRADAFVS